MTRLSTFSTMTLLASGLAMAGSVTANELENPGAETGDLSGWLADDGVIASSGTDLFSPLAGDWYFLIGDGHPLGEHTANLAQSVDVTECSNEHLNGEFTAAGSIATEGEHWGTLTVDFGEGELVMLDLLQSPSAAEWTAFGPVSGLVPNVESAVYQVSGSKVDEGELETAIQVAYDELQFTLNCVADFAKVSGRIGEDPRGRGKSPQWTFGGAVGTLEDGTLAASTIEINYREFDSVCEYSAIQIAYTSETSAAIEAEYLCTGGEKDGQSGIAMIDLTARNASGCTAHANKDRGSIAVTSDDAGLDIVGEFGETGGEACIDRGNVEIDAPEADVVEEGGNTGEDIT